MRVQAVRAPPRHCVRCDDRHHMTTRSRAVHVAQGMFVTGHLACRGLLALEKKATLTGNIIVGRLTISDGAKHTGQIQMGGL